MEIIDLVVDQLINGTDQAGYCRTLPHWPRAELARCWPLCTWSPVTRVIAGNIKVFRPRHGRQQQLENIAVPISVIWSRNKLAARTKFRCSWCETLCAAYA